MARHRAVEWSLWIIGLIENTRQMEEEVPFTNGWDKKEEQTVTTTLQLYCSEGKNCCIQKMTTSRLYWNGKIKNII